MGSFAEILKSLRPSRSNRFRVMLLCLAAATTFWFLNAMNKQHTTMINYPVQFIYDKQQYVEVNKLPDEVAMNVTGVGWNLLRNNLGIKTSPLLIPLDNPTEMKTLSAISLPSLIADQVSEFQLNYILTDTLHIDIDQRVNRAFSLHIDSLAIPLEEGYRITSPITISPDSVIFAGPRSYLENLPDTIILSLDDGVINDTFNQNISVPLPEKAISADPPIVQVAFNVDEYVNRVVEVPLNLVNLQTQDTLPSSTMITVSYSVQSNRADDINAGDFIIVGDLSLLGEDSTVVPRLTYYPLGLSDLKFDSAAVRIQRNE